MDPMGINQPGWLMEWQMVTTKPCQWGNFATLDVLRPYLPDLGLPSMEATMVLYRFAGGVPISKDYLEDHPMTCKSLITMVIVGPLSRVIRQSGL